MVFVKATLLLFLYDILSIFCGFPMIYRIVKCWNISRTAADQSAIDQICKAIDYACICYPKRSLCLQRSFVTTYLLRKNGIPAQMVLGAQKLPFRAHAWVEVNGRAINEKSNVKATYAVWERC